MGLNNHCEHDYVEPVYDHDGRRVASHCPACEKGWVWTEGSPPCPVHAP